MALATTQLPAVTELAAPVHVLDWAPARVARPLPSPAAQEDEADGGFQATPLVDPPKPAAARLKTVKQTSRPKGNGNGFPLSRLEAAEERAEDRDTDRTWLSPEDFKALEQMANQLPVGRKRSRDGRKRPDWTGLPYVDGRYTLPTGGPGRTQVAYSKLIGKYFICVDGVFVYDPVKRKRELEMRR
jgi:hypothetical protein